jgi:hypothetical protein
MIILIVLDANKIGDLIGEIKTILYQSEYAGGDPISPKVFFNSAILRTEIDFSVKKTRGRSK